MSTPTRDEFQNFRDDVKEDFERLHACDQRIEQKVDEIASKIDPLIHAYNEKQKKGERKFQVKLAGIAAAFGFVAAAIMNLFGGN